MTSAIEALLGRVIDEADAGQLPVLIAEWLETDDVRRWVALAIKLDLPILVERPELVVPCVLRRCGWLGAATAFYKPHAAEPTRDADAARALADVWRDAWRQPHLAALRPPHVPLDAGVIEEYRTSAQGELWLTADAIGVGTATAWERASGRRMAHAHRPPARPVWKLDRVHGVQGEAYIDAAGTRFRIALQSLGEEARAVFALDDKLGLVCTTEWGNDYEDEADHASYLVERATGRIVWRVGGKCLGAVSARDRVYVHGDHGIAIHDLATGEFLVERELPCRELAACDDGVFATRVDHVIRVWDPARIPAQIPALASSYQLVQLSPDETRVLTGYLLCDTRSGALIRALDLRGIGGWLEGGPPANCRRLCDGVLVEVNPFGTAVWETDGGTLVVDDRERGAGHRDAVAFDPHGRTHAIWAHRRKRLRVMSVRDGSDVFVTEAELADTHLWLGYTGDGDRVWWRAADERVRCATLATGDVHELDRVPASVAPAAATIVDGLLVAGELAIPIDAPGAIVTRDGSVIAAWNAHYVRR